jgi:hypothetical protein
MAELLVGLCVGLATFSASATTYRISQSGFIGGGSVSGSFTGEDLNHDGKIESFLGEVTAFNLTFVGSAPLPAFTHGLTDLRGLVYDVGSAFIGDSRTQPYGEGLLSGPIQISAGYQYNSGTLPYVSYGALILGPLREEVTSSTQLLAVTQVAEPATAALLTLGLFPLFLALRARSTHPQN